MTFLVFLAVVAAVVALLVAAVWLADPSMRLMKETPREEDVVDGE